MSCNSCRPFFWGGIGVTGCCGNPCGCRNECAQPVGQSGCCG